MKNVLVLLMVSLLLGGNCVSKAVNAGKIVQEDSLDREQASKIIHELYTDYVFGKKDFALIVKDVCTSRLSEILKESYPYNCEDGECYAVWLFRTNAQDGMADASKIKSIESKGNGWFDVSYLDMGHDGLTSIKFIEVDGKVMMDEIKKDKSHR